MFVFDLSPEYNRRNPFRDTESRELERLERELIKNLTKPAPLGTEGITRKKDEEGNLVLEFEVPGIPKESLKAFVKGNMLEVIGEHGDRKVYYKTRHAGWCVAPAVWNVENGILTMIFLPKPTDEPKNILSV